MPHPSPRYFELLDQYKKLHQEGDVAKGVPGAEMFRGIRLLPQAPRIGQLAAETGATSLLDYGCGKAEQYTVPYDAPDGRRWPTVLQYWGITQLQRYDPGYAPFSEKPTGKYDGVVCTDVLEHCAEEDMPWIFEELFSYAKKFVFVNAACFTAKKTLPNGENAHCTVKPPDWWIALFTATGRRYPHIIGEIQIQYMKQSGDTQTLETMILSNSRTDSVKLAEK
ncbi:MAG: class I SAM-dependent methyltransferase [Gammaproteobacteria bacterium]|nr:class I SAM-dependent methyltransferase [Gammaproteobacteria bacterium]